MDFYAKTIRNHLMKVFKDEPYYPQIEGIIGCYEFKRGSSSAEDLMCSRDDCNTCHNVSCQVITGFAPDRESTMKSLSEHITEMCEAKGVDSDVLTRMLSKAQYAGTAF